MCPSEAKERKVKMWKNDQKNPQERWHKNVPFKTPSAPEGSWGNGGGLKKRPFVPIFTAAPILTISFYTVRIFCSKRLRENQIFFRKKGKKE